MVGETSYFIANVSISRKPVGIRPKLLFMTNKKLHMRFRLTPRSMTLDDLELYKFEFSENLLGFRRFRTQQQLNEWTYTSIVSDNVVLKARRLGAIFGMLSRRAGLSATAGLSCHFKRDDSMLSALMLSHVRPSVCPSHWWISHKIWTNASDQIPILTGFSFFSCSIFLFSPYVRLTKIMSCQRLSAH